MCLVLRMTSTLGSGAPGRPASAQEEILGVLGADYHAKRKSKLSHRYRLRRRTDEVERAIRSYALGPVNRLVDIGTADGAMLDLLAKRLDYEVEMIGFDLSLSLLQCYEGNKAVFAQASAEALPLSDQAAEVVVGTAVIEHVGSPTKMLGECRRVLSVGGLLIITTPSPLMEEVATHLRLLEEDQHNETFSLPKLQKTVSDSGFDVLEAKPFMFSPIGFPFEKAIEKMLRPAGLGIMMANQLVVARRQG